MKKNASPGNTYKLLLFGVRGCAVTSEEISYYVHFKNKILSLHLWLIPLITIPLFLYIKIIKLSAKHNLKRISPASQKPSFLLCVCGICAHMCLCRQKLMSHAFCNCSLTWILNTEFASSAILVSQFAQESPAQSLSTENAGATQLSQLFCGCWW